MADNLQPLPIHLLERAAVELGLRPSFVHDLVKEDDWSFVVKAHALLESIVTQALLEHVAERNLHDKLARYELWRKRELLEAVAPELFDGNDRRFIKALSTLRNRLVHNVKRVLFTFADEVPDEPARQEFEGDFAAPFPGGLQPGLFAKGLELTQLYPRFIVWTSLMMVTMKVQGHKEQRRGFQRALIAALMKGGENEPTPPSAGDAEAGS